MKKLSFSLLLIWMTMTSAFATSLTPPPRDLLQVLSLLNAKHDGSLESINKVMQEKFLRKPGQERWEMESLYEDKRKIILPHLERLGVIDAVYPQSKTYDIIIIHGALADTMRERAQFLDILWSQGVRAKNIVFLSGERDLDPQLESEQGIFNPELSSVPFRAGWVRHSSMPATESEVALIVWDQVVTNDDLRAMKVHFVNAPKRYDSKLKKNVRPGTKETVVSWLESNPQVGKVLAISNNPYVAYQHQIVTNVFEEKGLLKNIDLLETVGSAADADTAISVHLDNIAHWVYSTLNK